MTEKITKADMVYRDESGEEWITAEGIALLWNKRSIEEFGREGRYTRWAARNRVENSGDLRFIDSPYGRVYNKGDAEKAKIRPRSKPRPDVKERASSAFKKREDLNGDDATKKAA